MQAPNYLSYQDVQRQSPLPQEQLPGPASPSASNNQQFQLGFVSIYYYMVIINFFAPFKLTVNTFYFLQPQKRRRWGEGTIPEETLDAFDQMQVDSQNGRNYYERFGETLITGYLFIILF